MENNKTNPIGEILDHSIQNLKSLVDVDTIIGTPIRESGVTIIPISKVTFGYGSGGAEMPTTKPQMPFGGGTGAGVTILPIALIVISEGKTEVVQITAPNSTADRIVTLIPSIFDKVSDLISDNTTKKAEVKKTVIKTEAAQ